MSVAGLRVDHVPEVLTRYPGEPITLYTRVVVEMPIAYRVQVSLPAGLQLTGYAVPDFPPENAPQIVTLGDGGQQVVWTAEPPALPDTAYEFVVHAVVESVFEETPLVSRAAVWALPEGAVVQESATLLVKPHSRYLRYLPAMYEDDDFMGRFLMLFDSFWHPLENVLTQIPEYFDPATAPRDLLPWLATWFDLVFDDHWPEVQRRRLLESVVWLYRQRGTRQGLQTYLEIYTGARPQVIEHRARNFRLGAGNQLGFGVALGKRNVPHTFTVILPLAPIVAATPEETQRLEQTRLRMIEQIIEAEKPAHTTYHLQIELDNQHLAVGDPSSRAGKVK